ncbi:Methylthioribose-1-phosphate isomerase [archaeon HR01]|nr:Methylthioribose-1-phosphate isomerase [archaeon HR01]
MTVFELMRIGIPVTVLTDNMVAYLMSQGEISKVVVGADRILAKTGHVINKIGTLSAAVNAHYFKIPFYVAAPLSTVDMELTPENVVIEYRNEDEVHYVGRTRITPKGSKAVNPAFDITPPELVTGIITEKGVFSPSELAKFLFG